MILVRFSNFGQGASYNDIGALDFIYAGIWSGLFYGIGGLIGLCASYERRKYQ